MKVGTGKMMALTGSVPGSNKSGYKVAPVPCELLPGLRPGTKGGVVGGGHV